MAASRHMAAVVELPPTLPHLSQQPSIFNQGETMNKHIDELSEGINDTFDTFKTLLKALVVAYNVEITKLLRESIEKSQTIEKLESGDRY